MRLTGRHVIIGLVLLAQLTMLALRLITSGAAYYHIKRMHSLVTFECLMIVGSIYIWTRLSQAINTVVPNEIDQPLPTNLRWRRICLHDVARALLLLFLSLSHISFVFYYIFLGTEPNMLAVVSLSTMAAYLHAFVFLLLLDFFYYTNRFLFNKIGRFSLYEYLHANRGLHILLAFFCGLLFMLGGLYSTSGEPVITEVDIPMRKFVEQGSEVRIALLSDIHIGPSVGRSRMNTIVTKTNGLNPDIIAIAGDLADGLVRDFSDAAAPLCRLRAPGGVYFATGNHEYMHGNVDEWFDYLRKCNITVLHNANVRQEVNGRSLCIAGADDLYAAKAHFPGHGMDIRKALRGCEEGDAVVLLAHQPNAAKQALKDPETNANVDLILSGHTHGGQMYLFVPIVYVANAFARGLYYYKSTQTYVYVSAGVNFFGPPIKMFNSCEIINIHLIPKI